MRRETRRPDERGAVLIISMFAIFIMAGLATSLFAVVQYGQNGNRRDADWSDALERAESGLERGVSALYEASIVPDSDFLTGLEPTSSSGAWILHDDLGGRNPYKVTLRSYKRDGLPVKPGVFDIYEVSSVCSPVGREGFIRGAQTTVELPISTTSQPGAIPGALYIDGGNEVQLSGNYLVDGADHLASVMVDDGVILKTDAKLENTYQASSAGYVSSFWVEKDGVAEKVFDDSKDGGSIGSLSEQVYQAGDKLNFFIETINRRDGTVYRHYAFGSGPDAMYYPPDGGEPKPYCRVEQIDDVTYRLFFEDLPGDYADWDYGEEGDLTSRDCIRSTGGDGPDQVVDVVILPEGTTTTGGGTSPGVSRHAGIPAIGYDGSYSGLGVPEDEDQLLTITEDGTNVSGNAAYADAHIPIDAYAAAFKERSNVVTSLTTTETYRDWRGRERTRTVDVDLGTSESPKVTYLDGDAGTLAGQNEGSGILIVNGDLHVSGQFKFEGLVVVLGDLQVTGGGSNSFSVLGAVMAAGDVKFAGNSSVLYSSEAIANALAAAGMTLEDLEQLLQPSKVMPPVYRVWRELNYVEAGALGLID
jgi:hypothetical protein